MSRQPRNPRPRTQNPIASVPSPKPNGQKKPTAPVVDRVAGIPVLNGNNDAEESATGAVSLSSESLTMTQKTSKQIIGLRFANVDLERGEKLTDCRIQFAVDEVSTEATELEIFVQAIDNAPAFRKRNGNISSRKTRFSVKWTVKPWLQVGDAGPDQRTPNLAQLINRMITVRQGWKKGNAIAFIITGTGKRVAMSANWSPSATRLILDAGKLPALEAIATRSDEIGMKCKVEYQGKWYKAIVLNKGVGHWYIRYQEEDEDEEWVGKDRIRFEKKEK